MAPFLNNYDGVEVLAFSVFHWLNVTVLFQTEVSHITLYTVHYMASSLKIPLLVNQTASFFNMMPYN